MFLLLNKKGALWLGSQRASLYLLKRTFLLGSIWGGGRSTPHAQLQFCNGTLFRQGFVQQSTYSGRTHYFRFRFIQLNRTFLPLCLLLFLFTFSIKVFRSVSGLSLIVPNYPYLSYLIGLDVVYHATVDDSNPIRNSKNCVRTFFLYKAKGKY